jgi:hypothetical protein
MSENTFPRKGICRRPGGARSLAGALDAGVAAVLPALVTLAAALARRRRRRRRYTAEPGRDRYRSRWTSPCYSGEVPFEGGCAGDSGDLLKADGLRQRGHDGVAGRGHERGARRQHLPYAA